MVNLGSGKRMPVKDDMPLPQAADAARKIGKMIATQKFRALNGRSIQDIETWDDADEAAAQAIAARLAQRQSVVGIRRRCPAARGSDVGAAARCRAL